MANRVPNVFIISPSTVASLNVLNADVEAGEQKQENFTKWLFPSNLLRHVLNLAYYLGLYPFKFIYKRVFSKQQQICQQVVCSFLHILMVYCGFVQLLDKIPDKEKAMKHLSLYFSYVLGVFGFVFVLLFIKTFWLGSEKFLKIMQTLQEEKDLPEIHNLTKNPWIVSVFCLQLLINLIFFLLLGYEMVTPISNLNPSTFLRRSVIVGRHLFLFRPMQNKSVIPDWDNITAVDGFLGVINAAYYYSGYSLYGFFKTVILACVLILWLECCTLATNVKALENGDKTWLQIYRQFEAIQKLSTVINAGLGNIPFWYIVTYLTNLSFNLSTFIVSGNYLKKLTRLHSTGTLVAFLYASADIRNKIERVYAWTQKDGNTEHVTKEQKRSIKFEKDIQQIGIHAGKYFVITFGTIYALVGLTITFFLICAADD